MKSNRRHPSARDFVTALAARGRYHFVSKDAQTALGVTPAAAKLALYRLAQKKLVASPARGFYVIVPPEYRSVGCLPAEQFVPALMKRLDLSYYVGLLSAAQYHGAGHQRPQQFQVFLAGNRRPLTCGLARVVFLVRKRLAEVPVQRFNTPRGSLVVSAPEATALDLVGYQRHAGGLENVSTVLAELAERIEPAKLATAAATAPVSWSQRLGYLLENAGASRQAESLIPYVQQYARESTSLVPGRSRSRAPRAEVWKLFVNAELDTAR